MNTKNIFLSLILMLFSLAKANAQEVLTLEDAVKIALENNYEIKIAANNLDIDKTNVAIGNAGMLPQVSADIISNNNLQNTTQTRLNGDVISLDNAKNNNLNYGVALDWTIFDGFKMFAKYDQLKEFQKLGDTQLKQIIIKKVSDVNAIYFDLVQQQQNLSHLDSTIVISEKRLNFTENRYTIGKGSKLDVLNAQVDLNTDLGNLLKQKQTYANSKTRLNQVLARELKSDFVVTETITVDSSLMLEELINLAQQQNPELILQIINKNITALQLKQIKGERYPVVRVNTGYNFNDTQSSLGFNTQSQAQGLNYGFAASINLFDGNAQNRNEKIAKMQIENSNLLIDQQKVTLNSELTVAFQTYRTNLELISLEDKNVDIAQKNLEITAEKFRIGTITSVEFRAAQLNFINSKIRLSNAQFQAKLSEIGLKELAGTITF